MVEIKINDQVIPLPTETHKKTVQLVFDFFLNQPEAKALTIAGSAARGKGSFDSDLDFVVFFESGFDYDPLLDQVNELIEREIKSKKPEDTGIYFGIDLHGHTGNVEIPDRHWTSGPDNYELEIGNIFQYCIVLFDKDGYFKNSAKKYLPYYDESLRQERLKEVLNYCRNNLWHIEPFVKRELYFQSFKRLQDASKEFLQALFISKRIYPIAYDKWIKEQLVEILKLPELYQEFVKLYEVHDLESDELARKAENLLHLIDQYIPNND